uniref:Protein farnesyltransferase/geranylgeranyltransferase type-1 subunit alpha n=1 Tax=Panagrellus redivivus TaxID=6233 RepID=A0A7E4VPY1_PANRE
MSGDSSSLYKNRIEWSDVTPIYNTAEEDSVVKIALRDEFVDAFAYLRAVMNSREVSARAFDLTTHCTVLNPANYSVWEYRRFLLKELNEDLKKELKFTEATIEENLKNYQVWHHRREIVLRINEPKVNMHFINEILRNDAKNYHAWQHRVFLVRHFKCPLEPERVVSERFIAQDLFNNSAWTYRFFVISEMSNDFENTEIIDSEIHFALTWINKMINNASSWSYLTGLMEFSSFTAHPELLTYTRNILHPMELVHKPFNLTESSMMPYALIFFAEANLALVSEGQGNSENILLARQSYERLIVVDPLRKRLWRHKLIELMNVSNTSSSPLI